METENQTIESIIFEGKDHTFLSDDLHFESFMKEIGAKKLEDIQYHRDHQRWLYKDISIIYNHNCDGWLFPCNTRIVASGRNREEIQKLQELINSELEGRYSYDGHLRRTSV